MLEVAIKSKSFGETPVLGQIDLTIKRGETLAITGPSGVGKSTLLRIVAGIDTDFDGTVSRPKSLAMVFQEPNLLPWRSALDNLLIAHTGLTRRRAVHMLDRVELVDKIDAFPGQLSLGQQRRLSLARAFACAPDLLIMDEPFVSLDPDLAASMLDLTETLIAEHRPATLFVTHNHSEADRLGNRVMTLQGAPAQLELATVGKASPTKNYT